MKLLKNGLAFGHIIECFDNTLYGFFSVLLAPIFFSNLDPLSQTLATFGAFAAGYITKPLGAIFFGIIGDSVSRNLPLLLSIGLVGIPTLIIGLLPSYQEIGMWAPLLLMFCRMLQGFFFGGEFAGVNVYIYETFPKNELGKNTGLLIASGVFGAIFAALAGFVAFLDILPTWSWRIPFILGGFGAFFTIKLRKNLQFLPAEYSEETHYMKSVKMLFKNYKKEMLFCFILAGLTTIPLNISTVYMNKIYGNFDFTPSTSMALNGLTMILNALFLVPCGIISDKIGFSKMIERGCIILFLVSTPAFWLLSGNEVSITQAVLFLFLMMASGTLINGCAFPYMTALFPKSCRYTGLSISYTCGIAFLSGTAPLIATALSHTFHSELAVAGYIMLISFITITMNRTIVYQGTRGAVLEFS